MKAARIGLKPLKILKSLYFSLFPGENRPSEIAPDCLNLSEVVRRM